jgi:transglutaminase-like putative cysteine protease
MLDWPEVAMPLAAGPRVVVSGLGDAPTGMPFQTSMAYDNLNDVLNVALPARLDGRTVTQRVYELDRATLATDHTTTDAFVVGAGMTGVPQTSHTDDLKTLADQITAGAASDYDKLLAIQGYLRSSRFEYTLEPDIAEPSDDAVWDFLQRGTGYCVHFASAMAVLARLEGLPMRVAVGFLVPPGGGDVTDAQAHMWPQAYFKRAGWVSFEPTPGSAGGAAASSASAQPSSSSASSGVSPSSSLPSSAASSATVTVSSSSTVVPTRKAGWGAGSLMAVAAVVVVALALAVAAGLRRRRWTPERAWAAVMRMAVAGGLVDEGATPRTVPTNSVPSGKA